MAEQVVEGLKLSSIRNPHLKRRWAVVSTSAASTTLEQHRDKRADGSYYGPYMYKIVNFDAEEDVSVTDGIVYRHGRNVRYGIVTRIGLRRPDEEGYDEDALIFEVQRCYLADDLFKAMGKAKFKEMVLAQDALLMGTVRYRLADFELETEMFLGMAGDSEDVGR